MKLLIQRVIIISFISSTLCNAAVGQWIRLHVQPAPYYNSQADFNDLSFLNADTGIVVGWNSAYLTTDGGINWKVLPVPYIPFYDKYNAIAFIDTDMVIIGSKFGQVYKSPDMGNSWVLISGAIGMINQILFKNRDTIIIALMNAQFWASFDGAVSFKSFSFVNSGITSQAPTITTSNVIYAITTGVINDLCDISMAINSCSFNGKECSEYYLGIDCASGLQMFNDTLGYAFAYYLLKTTDNWTTYDTVFSDSSFYAPPIVMGGANTWIKNNLHFFSPDTGFIIYNNGEVTYTEDGGHHYQHMYWGPQNKKLKINKIDCPDRNTCFGLGRTPFIYRFDFDSSFTLPSGNEEVLSELPMSIYPNPTSGFVNISLPSGDVGKATLRVYDFTGREVRKEEYANLSTSTLTLDISGNPPGLYLIELQTPKHTWYGKALLE